MGSGLNKPAERQYSQFPKKEQQEPTTRGLYGVSCAAWELGAVTTVTLLLTPSPATVNTLSIPFRRSKLWCRFRSLWDCCINVVWRCVYHAFRLKGDVIIMLMFFFCTYYVFRLKGFNVILMFFFLCLLRFSFKGTVTVI